MKNVFLLCGVVLIASCAGKKNYDPNRYMTGGEKDEKMFKIIRYLAKPIEGLSFEERFYPQYDSFYRAQSSLFRFDAFYKQKDGTEFFLVSKRAPSLFDKRVATGGKAKFDERGKLIEYEEVFRTWKMAPDTLARRGLLLFDLMVENKDLKPYETANSNGEDYIEFPDAHNHFNKALRRWVFEIDTTAAKN